EKKETEAQIEANTERRIESVLRFERKWLLRGPCARGTKIKARIDRDMQLINREKFEEDKGFTLQVAGRRLGGKILELHGIGKNYEKSLAEKRSSTGAEGKAEHPVIRNFSYKFTKGERIGIFGSNGTGKSTLLNIITGTIEPDTGSIDVGVNTVFGYYQQNPVFKDKSLTVLEYIKEAAEYIQMNDGRQLSAAQFLNEFGFEGKIQHSMLSTLSGGELKRVFLVRLLISNPNFLILDEPTNDFDIFTLNILEDFLLGYQGCLLIVSHDRYFMDKIADTLFVMEDDGAISGFVGKCSEYIDYLEEQKKKGTSLPPLQSTSPGGSAPKPPENLETAGKTPSPKKKRSFKEQREFEELEALILELEEKKPELEAQMAGTDFAKIQAASTQYAELTAKLDKAYGRWSELAELG
ncbi:MAG: ABC-F family ATP-binding cassette domain-containing protein, partial [Treponema sp.]|nr:ABC-F family ATP-binding cassette domain-containing protein [Treponema sp.]